MRRTTISPNKKEEVIGYLKEGKSQTEIGKLIGYSRSAVGRFIKKYNLSEKNKSSKPKMMINWEEKREYIKKLYIDDKLNRKTISEKLGISISVLKRGLKKLGLSIKKKSTKEEKICPICGKHFTSKHSTQVYCSNKCRSIASRKLPSNDILLEKLEKNNWNYLKTGTELGISDSAVGKWTKKLGIHKSFGEKTRWADVVDLDSAQSKIDELKIKTFGELNSYKGLKDKLRRLNVDTNLLKFPGTKFDSSWEEKIFNLIKDNVSYTSLQHNIILDPEKCRYKNPLVFDIVIEYPDYTKVVIEIQGPTHFKTIHGGNGRKVSDVRKRDEIKYEYCITHNIDLYYFTYDQKLIDKYGYSHYVYTDENLLLEKLKSYSSPSL